MRKKLILLIAITAMLVSLSSCSPTLIGKWRIVEAAAGDVVMTEEDISSMGVDAGFIKINKSGSCVINLLGDEYEGSWTGDSSALEINMGENMTASAAVNEEGIMTLKDSQGAEYKLKK